MKQNICYQLKYNSIQIPIQSLIIVFQYLIFIIIGIRVLKILEILEASYSTLKNYKDKGWNQFQNNV